MRFRIAIVDDEEKILTSLERYFTLRNFLVNTYTDPAIAYTSIKTLMHKIVLTDINMPKMDGLQLMQKLKKHNPLIQVIIMTGDATADKVKQAIKEGANGFVVKPFDSLQMLEREVDRALANVERTINKHR